MFKVFLIFLINIESYVFGHPLKTLPLIQKNSGG